MRVLLSVLASSLGGSKLVRRSFAVLLSVVCVVACAGPPVGHGEGGGGAAPLSGVAATGSARPAAPPGVSPGFDVGDVVRQVRLAYRPEGSGWSGGVGGYRVHATAERFEITPVRESEAPGAGLDQGAPAVFETAAIGRGKAPPPARAGRGRVEPDGHLALDRAGAVEHLRNDERGVEQSFSFVRPPEGEGDLTVRVRVTGQGYAGETAAGLHFVDPATGLGVRYGLATWIDAEGAETPVEARFEGGEIVLEVPEATVLDSVYPAVLDPTISPEIDLDDPVPGFAPGNQSVPNVAFDGQNYLVAWYDSRAFDLLNDQRLYGARVTPSGALLDPGGLLLTNQSTSALRPAVAFNGTSYVVVWKSTNLMSTLVNPDGTVVNPQGTLITSSGSAIDMVDVAFSGGSGLVVYQWNATDILARRLDGAGAPVGATITISSATNIQGRPRVAFDGTNWVVVWQDYRSGTTYDIYGARVTPAGTVLDPAGFIVSAAAGNQTRPSIAFDGANYLVAWSDSKLGTQDIYGTLLAPGGAVLNPTGIGVTSGVGGTQTSPSVAFDGSLYHVVWSDTRSGGYDIYTSTLDVNGAVLIAGGSALSAGSADEQEPGLACGNAACLAVWQDQRSGSDLEIFGTRVDGGGTALDPDGLLVSGAATEQLDTAVAFGGTDYLVVWRDRRSPTDFDIYGTRVSPAGAVLDPAGIAVSTAGGDQLAPAVASDGSGYLVVWEDKRGGSPGDIYGARLDAGGAVLDPNGLLVSDAANEQRQPALTWNGSSYLVVWDDLRTTDQLYGARVTPAGSVLDPAGILIHPNTAVAPAVAFGGNVHLVVWYSGASVFGRRVAPDGTLLGSSISIDSPGGVADLAFDGTSFLVVYGRTNDIYGQRVTPAGSVIAGGPFAISTEPGNQLAPAVAFNGTEHVVAWRDHRAGAHYEIYGTLITPAGDVLQPAGLLMSGGVDHISPGLASDGAGHALLVYAKGDTAPPYSTHRARGRLVTSSLTLGTACTADGDCASGFCADGVCCNTSCGGDSPDDCFACSVAAGAAADGTCASLTAVPCSVVCLENTVCQAGACVGTPVSCSPPGECEGAGTCDPGSGQCVYPVLPDGSACDDGDPCTAGDACHAGNCSPAQAVDCPAPDDCHLPGVCDPSSGACSYADKPDGSGCDDGNPCTQSDTCSAGACVGADPVVCVPIDPCHAAGVCNPANGICSIPLQPAGTPCDDGNPCTLSDACSGGVCVGADPVVCMPSDQCHAAGVCNPATGLCSNPQKPNGTACDDGNQCTTGDKCQAGGCTSGVPEQCPQPGPCQLAVTCNPASGACEVTLTPNGTVCNDGDPCTTGDACQSGTCTSGAPVQCPAPGPCHAAIACNPASGQCEATPLPDGAACDDGNQCTTSDKCQSGACTSGAPVQCPAPGPCQTAVTCDPASGQCEATPSPDGTACDDGDKCTTSDTCQSGVCQGASPVACPGDECHADGTCDPGTGACDNPALPDGTPCENGGKCEAGSCVPPGTGGGGDGGTGGSGTGGAATGTGGGASTPPDSGCGCWVAGEAGDEGALRAALAILGLTLGLARRRRRGVTGS